jgi:hypothetical protein
MTDIGRTIQALEGLNMAESCGSSRIAGDQLAMTLIDPKRSLLISVSRRSNPSGEVTLLGRLLLRSGASGPKSMVPSPPLADSIYRSARLTAGNIAAW